MIFGFLAIKREGYVTIMLFRQSRSRRSCDWNALLVWTIEHEGFGFPLGKESRVKMPQSSNLPACVEQAGVKKVRANPPGFESKLTKSKNLTVDRKLEKIRF